MESAIVSLVPTGFSAKAINRLADVPLDTVERSDELVRTLRRPHGLSSRRAATAVFGCSWRSSRRQQRGDTDGRKRCTPPSGG